MVSQSSDNNWDIKSYVNVFEINNLDDYCRFQNSRKHLPSLDTFMFFMMRKKSDYDYIYHMWEDDNNKNGGCWSFKISSDSLDKIWDVLSSYLVGENIGNNYDNSMKINGISFSPKKGFSIVKIWNENSENKELIKVINNELSDYLNLEDNMYKSHLENISKDLKKKKRFEKNTAEKILPTKKLEEKIKSLEEKTILISYQKIKSYISLICFFYNY